MKLIDALNKKGAPYWIPDCSRNDLPEFFKELGFKKGAEIGVFVGEFMVRFCEAGMEMIGIDPWDEVNANNLVKKRKPMDAYYKMAQELTKPYPNCHLIRKTSMEALSDIPDKSLDFVYIDGNHSLGYTAMDLEIWSKKVRKRGIIAGHDYWGGVGNVNWDRKLRHVKYAVDAFTACYDFTNWYVIGSKGRVEGEHRDKRLSYFMIKHW